MEKLRDSPVSERQFTRLQGARNSKMTEQYPDDANKVSAPDERPILP